MYETIDVNGVLYKTKSADNSTPAKKRPNLDIVKEYALIQQKKSLLTKSQRDWVVFQFESKYELVT
jgi:hypothetical protein